MSATNVLDPSDKSPDRGLLITLEGGEGSGKTTQQKLLATQLQALGWPCLCTREPGGSSLGQALRQLVLNGEGIPPLTELLLYITDRAHHVATVIQPALATGTIVIADRFADSTVAYQGYGRGLDLDLIHPLNTVATQGIQPDLTFWIQVPVATGLARARQRGSPDRMEQATLEFHERIAAAWPILMAQDPQRWHMIDGQGSPTEVAERLWAVFIQRFPWIQSSASRV